jgi:hypothetical protein
MFTTCQQHETEQEQARQFHELKLEFDTIKDLDPGDPESAQIKGGTGPRTGQCRWWQ